MEARGVSNSRNTSSIRSQSLLSYSKERSLRLWSPPREKRRQTTTNRPLLDNRGDLQLSCWATTRARGCSIAVLPTSKGRIQQIILLPLMAKLLVPARKWGTHSWIFAVSCPSKPSHPSRSGNSLLHKTSMVLPAVVLNCLAATLSNSSPVRATYSYTMPLNNRSSRSM